MNAGVPAEVLIEFLSRDRLAQVLVLEAIRNPSCENNRDARAYVEGNIRLLVEDNGEMVERMGLALSMTPDEINRQFYSLPWKEAGDHFWEMVELGIEHTIGVDNWDGEA